MNSVEMIWKQTNIEIKQIRENNIIRKEGVLGHEYIKINGADKYKFKYNMMICILKI